MSANTEVCEQTCVCWTGAFKVALPGTGQHVPADQRASEQLREGRGVWPQGMTSLTSSTEMYDGARLTEKCIQSEEEKHWGQR